MKIQPSTLTTSAIITSLLLASSFTAARAVDADLRTIEDAGVEINRSPLTLNDAISARPEDRDFINTAIVLSDRGDKPSLAFCVARNADGSIIGRAYTKIAANGVSLLLASDLTQGRDFLGKISCKSRGHVVGTAYILGPDFSDTQVMNLHDRAGSVVTVPVAISR